VKRLLFIFLFFAPLLVVGQNTDKFSTVDLVYQKEFTAGLKLLSNGYGFEINFKKTPNIRYKTVKQFEFLELKDPSNFYALNFSYGQDRVVTRKGRKNGVALYWSWKAGPSLGIIKPYYLSLQYGDGSIQNERYSEDNANIFLNNTRIAGGAGFAKGLDEIKIKPGASAKVSAGADWASKRDFIKSAEIGLVVNVFTGDVPIMLIRDNSFLFANLYIGVLFGRRK